MAVITVCSAKGAPGVTTTALLLAALWPRPVLLVDADPAGGDIALRMPDPNGQPLDPDRGLLSLLPLARRSLAPQALLDHAQIVSGGTPVLAGLAGPEQAGAVGALWQNLAVAFTGATVDVIVDAGRLHSTSVHLPLAQNSDVLLTVVRAEVGGVLHVREQQRALGPLLQRPDGGIPTVGLLVVHEVRDPATVDEVGATIQAAASWVKPFGQLADDVEAAGMFAGRPVRRPERSMLVRSGLQVVQTLITRLPAALPAPVQAAPVQVAPVQVQPAPAQVQPAPAQPAPAQAAAATAWVEAAAAASRRSAQRRVVDLGTVEP